MAFTITLVLNRKKKNSTAKNVTNAICSPTVELKGDTSIIRPTFVLDLGMNGMTNADNVVKANYLVCLTFKRYYWIKDITFVSYDVCEIECIVDPFATFASNILNSTAYINYASMNYNNMMPDNRIPFSGARANGMFEYTFNALDVTGCYILTIATASGHGATGLTQSFCMTQANLSSLAAVIYGNDLWSKIKDNLYSPGDAIISCTWLPVKQSAIAGTSAIMFLGDYMFGTYSTVETTTSTIAYLVVDLPYMDANRNYDWRNMAPYTNWYIWLPGVGFLDFPMELCLNGKNTKPNIQVGLQISPTNGECSYNITCNGLLVMFCKGNLGVQLPVGKGENSLNNVMSGVAGVAAGVGMAIATKNPAFAIGGGISASASALSAGVGLIQSSVSGNGSIGGWATPQSLIDKVRLFYSTTTNSTNPFGSVKEIIGCPVFKEATLSSYSGAKVFCSNINFNWDGELAPTAEEYDMIRAGFVSEDGMFLEEI